MIRSWYSEKSALIFEKSPSNGTSTDSSRPAIRLIGSSGLPRTRTVAPDRVTSKSSLPRYWRASLNAPCTSYAAAVVRSESTGARPLLRHSDGSASDEPSA